jgi:adenosyl cobinamide kinase/adenosyl cobinamide phosphate guanylyltransferase
MIQQLTEAGDKFELVRGNHTMTLSKDEFGWNMVTHNPSTRAWNNEFGSFRRFSNLLEVEKVYKSWRGVSSLVN